MAKEARCKEVSASVAFSLRRMISIYFSRKRWSSGKEREGGERRTVLWYWVGTGDKRIEPMDF